MRIGIIGAMNEEITRFLQGMDVQEQTEQVGITYYQGLFADKEIVLCKSGVGKVNAAITTQVLIDRFKVENVIFTGVAGAVDPVLDIGDIVVSQDAMYHDMDVTALGYDKGIIPFFDQSVFVADNKLVELAVQAGQEATEAKVVTGRILSGDQFIANKEHVQDLHRLFKGACTEMEGAATAHVCAKNTIPFVIVRSMSDRADGSAHVNFAEFVDLASERSYAIVRRMLSLF